MVPFIFSLFLLLSWVLLGTGRRKGWVTSLPQSPSYDDWACSAFSLVPFWMPGDFMYLSKLSECAKAFWELSNSADLKGSLQLLTSSHLRERDKMLLRAILCGGVWNGFLLGKAKKEDAPCRFCGKKRWRWASYSGNAPFSTFQHDILRDV